MEIRNIRELKKGFGLFGFRIICTAEEKKEYIKKNELVPAEIEFLGRTTTHIIESNDGYTSMYTKKVSWGAMNWVPRILE